FCHFVERCQEPFSEKDCWRPISFAEKIRQFRPNTRAEPPFLMGKTVLPEKRVADAFLFTATRFSSIAQCSCSWLPPPLPACLGRSRGRHGRRLRVRGR